VPNGARVVVLAVSAEGVEAIREHLHRKVAQIRARQAEAEAPPPAEEAPAE